MSAERVRLFFACPVPTDVGAYLLKQIAPFSVCCGGFLTNVDDLHLTLSFLGNLPRERIEAALRAGASLGARPSFVLSLDRQGRFAHSDVVWMGSRNVPADLFCLRSDLNEALAAEGFASLERDFLPHVSLLRHGKISMPLPEMAHVSWKDDRFALFESEPAASGRRYAVLGEWMLSDAVA